MTIGERIKKRRLELNMTQEELANKLGYKSKSSINKIELNGRNLTQPKIKLIADVLQTTPEYIMGWGQSEVPKKDHNLEYHKNTKKERELVTKYRVLDDHGKVVVDTVLQIEYDRVTTEDDVYLNAAHTRTDVESTDELMKHDDDIMNDPDF